MGAPWPDPWVTIAYLAGQTTTLRFFTNIYVLPARPPVAVAKLVGTAAVLSGNRVALGIGMGWMEEEFDAMGQRFAGRGRRADEMLDVVRLLWTGEVVEHHGEYYDVEHARLYSLPETPVPVYVSGFGSKSAELAGRIGDGFICTKPDPDLIQAFRDAGGEGKPTQVGTKVCYGPDEDAARETAHEIWRNEGLPGELAQVLPTPEHFQQASSLVQPEAMVTPVGPDQKTHVEALRRFVEAGYDELYVQQIGPDQEAFFEFFAAKVLPELR
jgi:G6PDH family F420-dependent oxidoreductase